jgi:hypothetical protein
MDESNHLLVIHEHVLRPLILPRRNPTPILVLAFAFTNIQ